MDVYTYLTDGIKCPYCQNQAKTTSEIWDDLGFEQDAMTGYLQYRNGWFVFKERWLCIKCERDFDVKVTIRPQSHTVRFKRVKS